MSNHWYRIGSLEHHLSSRLYLEHNVIFKNTAKTVKVKALEFNFALEQAQLWISLSPFSDQSLYELSQKFLTQDEIELFEGRPKKLLIKITSHEIFDKINNFLTRINKKNIEAGLPLEFPATIFAEISGIFQRLFPTQLNVAALQVHLIPELILPNVNCNPKKVASTELVNYLDFQRLQVTLSKVKQYLREGQNPNQRGSLGCMPLSYAAMGDNVAIVELLLCYGADPLLEDHEGMSSIEIAQYYGRPKIITIIMATLVFPEKPKIKIKKIELSGTAKEHHSHLYFSNGALITTSLKPTQSLAKLEIETIFAIFNRYFENANNNSHELQNEFVDELIGDNKLIEIIILKNNGKTKIEDEVIGFNLIEIFGLKHYLDYVVVNSIYALIKDEYRGYRIMSLLAFRLPFVCQALLPIQVLEYFCALHYNSFRMVENLLLFPKYFPENILMLLSAILQKIYGAAPPLQVETDAVFLQENIRVKGPQLKKGPTDIMQNFYLSLSAQESRLSSKPRSVPVLFFAKSDNLLVFEKNILPLGINFSSHVRECATSMRPLFHQYLQKYRTKARLAITPHSFWEIPVPCKENDRIRARL